MILEEIQSRESENTYTFYTNEIFIGGSDSSIEKNIVPNPIDEIHETVMSKEYYFYSKGINFESLFDKIISAEIYYIKEEK